MPKFIVKQPNGLFAAFSTVVDNFTAYDMTREEAIEYIGDESKVRRAADDADLMGGGGGVDEYRHLGEGLARWHYCLEIILSVHGWKELRAILLAIVPGEQSEDESV